jgi:hypothetical protein
VLLSLRRPCFLPSPAIDTIEAEQLIGVCFSDIPKDRVLAFCVTSPLPPKLSGVEQSPLPGEE